MVRGLATLLCLLAATSAVGPPASAGPPSLVLPRRPLPFFYDLYTFRGTGGKTAVVAAFAIPAGRLEKERADDGIRYRFDVSLVLADTALRTVYRTDDTVFVQRPHGLAGDHLLYTHVQLQAPPSLNTLQRVIMNDETTPGIGQLYTSPFPVPDYSGDELMLSDIALGVPDEQTGLRRGGVRLALLPTSLFPEGAFDLYYEVYNLPLGHPYSTEITVEPTDREGREEVMESRKVRTRFSGQANPRPDGTVAEIRRVDASLSTGRYRLTITVTDDITGASAKRWRLFEVRDDTRQATLVPALPRRGSAANGR